MADPAAEFEWYTDWAADVTPLYETLATAAADDERILDVAAAAPEGQPAPQLLLAAVHSLLLEDDGHPLASFYPTCGGGSSDECPAATDSPATDTVHGDPTPHFREFCREHEDELRNRIASRRVQTNAVGRSAILIPAFTHVARQTASDGLALIELGASAGLNLTWDRYRYTYRRAEPDAPDNSPNSNEVRRAGDANAPVTIRCDLRGDDTLPVPESVPRVDWRVGVDLAPLDPTDPADARWLHALVPPDQPDRHRRLGGALEVARDHPPLVREGDVVEQLPHLLAAAPTDAALVVYSTHFCYQLPDGLVDRIRSILRAHSRQRPVDWLSNDPTADAEVPVYRRVAFRDGVATEQQLGQFASYGEWVRWVDE